MFLSKTMQWLPAHQRSENFTGGLTTDYLGILIDFPRTSLMKNCTDCPADWIRHPGSTSIILFSHVLIWDHWGISYRIKDLVRSLVTYQCLLIILSDVITGACQHQEQSQFLAKILFLVCFVYLVSKQSWKLFVMFLFRLFLNFSISVCWHWLISVCWHWLISVRWHWLIYECWHWLIYVCWHWLIYIRWH